MSREVLGSGDAGGGVDADVVLLDDPGEPTRPADLPGRRPVSRRGRIAAAAVALLAVVAGGLVHARWQEDRDRAARRVVLSAQAARPVGELRTYTDAAGPHAVTSVAVAVLSEGRAPLQVVDAALVGTGVTVPLRHPPVLAPGQAGDLEASALDPCPAPLGLDSVRLTVRSGAGTNGTNGTTQATSTLTLPVPGGLDGLSQLCPPPVALPLRADLRQVRASAQGQVVAGVEVLNTGAHPVVVDSADLTAGSAGVGATVEPAAPFTVPAGRAGRPSRTEVTITAPAPPCAHGMFSTYNDIGDPASLNLGYESPADTGAGVGATDAGTLTQSLVVDLGEAWKAARHAAMARACGD